MEHNNIYTLNFNDAKADVFDWGEIRWLCNSKLVPGSKQTFGRVVIHPGKLNGRHLHPNCEEIIFIAQGQCEHYVDDDMVNLREGDVIFVPENARHYAVNTGDDDVVMIISYSSPDRETKGE